MVFSFATKTPLGVRLLWRFAAYQRVAELWVRCRLAHRRQVPILRPSTATAPETLPNGSIVAPLTRTGVIHRNSSGARMSTICGIRLRMPQIDRRHPRKGTELCYPHTQAL